MFSDMSDDEEACIALAIALKVEKKTRNKKRMWMKESFENREEYTYENLLKELHECEPDDFRCFLCMDETAFDILVNKVTPLIQKQDTVLRNSISVCQRLSITFHYLATGNSFEDLKSITAISPQSIAKIVIETCQALIDVLKDNIKTPTCEQEWKMIAEGFENKWNFPNCIGAVDGKHVAIKKPPEIGSSYYNYKKFFSIVLLAAVNSNYEFIMVDASVNGKISDDDVLGCSKFGKALYDKSLHIPKPDNMPHSSKVLPYVFVGDNAFTLTDNFIIPYSRVELNFERRIYNYRLSRARRIAENAFGLLVSRFGVFHRTINLSPEKVQIIVLACCYLHNYLIHNLKDAYITPDSVDFEDTKTSRVLGGAWRQKSDIIALPPFYNKNASTSANEVRHLYCNYFSNEGKVAWQDNFLKLVK